MFFIMRFERETWRDSEGLGKSQRDSEGLGETQRDSDEADKSGEADKTEEG